MKRLLLLIVISQLAACGLWQRSKVTVVDKIVEKAQENSVKYLKCSTGEPVAKDVRAILEKALKVKSQGQEDAKSIGGDICVAAIKIALPLLIDLGEDKLPILWYEDGCRLDQVGDQLEVLALKLCEEIP